MNKERRKRITALLDKVDVLRSDLSDELRDELESIGGEEREYFDNMPEAIQAGEKGQAASDAADELEAALEDFDAARSGLDECISRLQNLD